MSKISKDRFGRRLCDRSCPAWNGEFCNAGLDYIFNLIDVGNPQRYCKIKGDFVLNVMD